MKVDGGYVSLYFRLRLGGVQVDCLYLWLTGAFGLSRRDAIVEQL
jgi:hypothetical protein